MKDWSRSWLGPLYVQTLLVQAVTFVLRPTAVYQGVALGVPAGWLGALSASFAVVPLALALPLGHVVDRFGERRAMSAGAAFMVASTVVFLAFGGSVWGLLAGSVTLGAGHLGSVVGQQSLLANRMSAHRYDGAFGHYTFVASAGQALGPGLIVAFGGNAPIPDTGRIFGSTVAMATVLAITCAWLPGNDPSAGDAQEGGSVAGLLRRGGVLRALVISCVVLSAVDISLAYLPALGTERGIAAGTIGALLTVRAVASMVSRFFLGALAQWLGRAFLLTGSIALSAVAMALAPVPMPTWCLTVVIVAVGLGLGTGQPLTMSRLAEAAPPGLRGRAMSLRLTGNRLGQVVVPSLAGIAAVGSGAAGVLWLTSAALGAVGLASRRLPRTDPDPA